MVEFEKVPRTAASALWRNVTATLSVSAGNRAAYRGGDRSNHSDVRCLRRFRRRYLRFRSYDLSELPLAHFPSRLLTKLVFELLSADGRPI